ncbi:fucolectin-like [Rhinoderma darwinii]|uniref:fucolectin-like n=1 Tax=Rhinoderma darwinii TaxID=43563 RepID=UPI003F67ED73
MFLLSSVFLIGSLALELGCSLEPGATNIARNGEASQESDYQYQPMGYAKNAIDGVTNANYQNGSCTHTNSVKDAWWRVDLKQIYKILTVVLTNRQDCCAERLMGAEVRIGNSPDNNNPVCATVTSVVNTTMSFWCDGMEGQYVSVVIANRKDYLTLCEVEVYGDLVNVVPEENKICW